MRHRVYGRHLGRDKDERKSLFRGLIRELILHESIVTTEAKAKSIKGLVDRLIAKSKAEQSSSRRVVERFLPHKEIVKKLIEEVAPRYKERSSGFTNLVRLGQRAGDGSMMVRMSLIEETSKEKEGTKEPKTVREEKEEKPEKVNKPAKAVKSRKKA